MTGTADPIVRDAFLTSTHNTIRSREHSQRVLTRINAMTALQTPGEPR